MMEFEKILSCIVQAQGPRQRTRDSTTSHSPGSSTVSAPRFQVVCQALDAAGASKTDLNRNSHR